MQKTILFVPISLVLGFLSAYGSRQTTGIPNTEMVRAGTVSSVPSFVKFKKGSEIDPSQLKTWMTRYFQLNQDYDLGLLSIEKDKTGGTHYRYQQTYKSLFIQSSMFIVHYKNEKIESMNGELYNNIACSTTPSLSEKQALEKALLYVNAEKYKWEPKEEEDHLKQLKKDPQATHFPKGQLILLPPKKNNTTSFALTYKFDIYATKPLKRQNVFVDASSGKILFHLDKIHTADVLGTAMTKYSGTQTITTSSSGGNFVLNESGRGSGISTYNMLAGIEYNSAVDFTDANNVWNNVNAQKDEAATDAHWAAEKTYDYYFNTYGRNSIDDSGMALMSYVHYDVDFLNAFWDGQEMTYGDGDSSNNYNPLTSLDVGGHEITHGLTQFTAALGDGDESNALNESFSDIFGKTIEHTFKPSTATWIMGQDIGEAFRDMSDPKSLDQPDTYYGENWDSLSNEPHQNNGPQNYWFYLLSNGGSGTNDLNNNYSVNAVGLGKAAAIAYRALTVYLTPSSGYSDSKFFSIQAAIDLYGDCSPEMESTTNAWYAVGVAAEPYSADATSNFKIKPATTFCETGDTIHFTNLSSNAGSYLWNFGDGTTSSDISPYHVYTSFGNFDVKLKAVSGCGKSDSTFLPGAIKVDANYLCAFMPVSGKIILTKCSGMLTDDGGLYNDYSNDLSAMTTIAPTGTDSVKLTFISFDLSVFSYYSTDSILQAVKDSMIIYDGLNENSPIIGIYSGKNLPNGGAIMSSAGAITLKMETDSYFTGAGFVMNWECFKGNGIQDNDPSPVFSIFSNPSKGDFTIRIESHDILYRTLQIDIYNYLGERVHAENSFCSSDVFVKNISLNQFSGGMYHISINTGKQHFNDKVLVVK